MTLSLIIPCYNTGNYLDELLAGLLPQMNNDTEVIIVDDGSDVPYQAKDVGVTVYRQENKGVSAARNLGMNKAKGEYIAFIDSDDRVDSQYLKKIFEKLKAEPDTIYLSWKSIDGRLGKIIKSEDDEFNPWNRCVWNRVFKVSWLNGLRFNERLRVAEDDDFLKRLPAATSKTYIEDPIYFYRSGRAGSLTDLNLKQDAQVKPRVKTQVAIYCASMQNIGGIETWLYYFCENMHKDYDIMVLFSERMDGRQIARLSEIVQVMKLTGNCAVECDTLINTRITDKIPALIIPKRIIQMVHGCYSVLFCCDIQPQRDQVVCVSQVVKDSYQNLTDAEVIHNFTYPVKPKQSLFLITASRFTCEKGGDRYLKLTRALRNAGVNFKWFFFSNQTQPIKDVFKLEQNKELKDSIFILEEDLDVKSWIAKCDYLVQLSDSEGFGYSIVEALELGVPVITTPVDVLPELGFVNGQDGYIVPFDMADIDARQFLDVPETKWSWDNSKIHKQWVKLLGKSKPTGEYLRIGSHVKVEIIENYNDLELGRALKVGEVVNMRRARANLIVGCGKGVIVK